MTRHKKPTRSSKVSIGLPPNGETSVTEALDSSLAQTFTNFELIISDKASTDDTEEQFHLPAALVDLGDSKCWKREVVGENLESLPDSHIEINRWPSLWSDLFRCSLQPRMIRWWHRTWSGDPSYYTELGYK